MSSLAVGQIVEIPAMTVANVTVDMDNVGAAGPTSLAAINGAATPTPASMTAINLTLNAGAAAGVYNTNPQGRALAVDSTGGLILVDPPTGAFAAFNASIDLGCQVTEFGCSIGDWNGPMIFTCYLAGASIGTVQIDYTGGGSRFLQSTVGPFDRVDFVASTTAGNWCIPDLHLEVCGPPPPVDYQTNVDAATLTVNGTFVNAFFPTIVNIPIEVSTSGTGPANNGVGTLNVSAINNPGARYDVLWNTVPVVPLSGSGIPNPAGGSDIININVFGAGFTSMNSGGISDVSLRQFPGNGFPGSTGTSFNTTFSLGPPFAGTTISVQGVITDPTVPAGFRMTGATQIDFGLVTVP